VHEKLVREVGFLTDGSDGIRLICATNKIHVSSVNPLALEMDI